MELQCKWEKGEMLTSAISRALNAGGINDSDRMVALWENKLFIKSTTGTFQGVVPAELLVWGKKEKKKKFTIELC